jgi:hypothetical protein
MSTMTESRNDTNQDKSTREEIQELKHALELQTATQAGVDATEVATTAGAQATQAAAHAGTWSTMVAGSAGFVVGMFVALAFVATTR